MKRKWDNGIVGGTIPLHDELDRDTLVNALHQLHIDKDEFNKAWKESISFPFLIFRDSNHPLVENPLAQTEQTRYNYV